MTNHHVGPSVSSETMQISYLDKYYKIPQTEATDTQQIDTGIIDCTRFFTLPFELRIKSNMSQTTFHQFSSFYGFLNIVKQAKSCQHLNELVFRRHGRFLMFCFLNFLNDVYSLRLKQCVNLFTLMLGYITRLRLSKSYIIVA